MKQVLFISTIILFIACNSEIKPSAENSSEEPQFEQDLKPMPRGNELLPKTQIIEEAQLDSTIGNTQYYRFLNDLFLEVTFYSEKEIMNVSVIYYSANNEKKVQKFNNLDSEYGSKNPRLLDFNSDGVLDLQIDYKAIGSNQLSYVYLRQSEFSEFILLPGSSNVSCIFFDTDRKTIISTYRYSGTSFIDLKLENDSLIRTAGVDSWTKKEWTFHNSYDYDSLGNKINEKTDSLIDQHMSLNCRSRIYNAPLEK